MTASVSGQAFRDALAQFASGVTIVAAHQGAELAGLTATAFSAVSLDPPLVLVCVAHSASSYQGIVDAERLGISILAEEQAGVALQIAKHGGDKFGGVALLSGRPVPLVAGALAHLETRRHARHEAGDHTILIAEVVEASVNTARPLVHYARKLGAFAAGA